MGSIIDDVVSIGSFGLIDTDFSGQDAGNAAANASLAAANTSAAYQQQALDYLKEREELPQQFRDEALQFLGGVYGLEGGTGSQQQLIDQAMASPLYGLLTGNKAAGEEAILRNASATGGLRSGSTQHNLYDYNTQLENQALLESYNQQLSGLSGLASLPSNASQIATGISGIGNTLAQGQTASAQAQLQAQQGGMQNLLGLGQLGVGLLSFSDARLKQNVRYLKTVNGVPWYRWRWNHLANELGFVGEGEGVIAQLTQKTHPHAISTDEKTGYLMVNYTELFDLEGQIAA